MRTNKVSRPRGELMQGKMFRACAGRFPGRHPSDVVEYLRLGEGMTLVQAAEYLGVSKTTVSEWQRPGCSFQLVTEKSRAASRRNVRQMNEINRQRDYWRNHIWNE